MGKRKMTQFFAVLFSLFLWTSQIRGKWFCNPPCYKGSVAWEGFFSPWVNEDCWKCGCSANESFVHETVSNLEPQSNRGQKNCRRIKRRWSEKEKNGLEKWKTGEIKNCFEKTEDFKRWYRQMIDMAKGNPVFGLVLLFH